MSNLFCTIPGCSRRHEAQGYCPMHYRRYRLYGDPGPVEPVKRPNAIARAYLEGVLATGCWGDDCIEWPFNRQKNGYGRIKINGKDERVHAVACTRIHGPCPPGLEARHLCNNRACFNPNHLEWSTRKRNHEDKIAAGTALFGERNHQVKLTTPQVEEIRTRYASGGTVSQRTLATEYRVTQSTISHIVTNKQRMKG